MKKKLIVLGYILLGLIFNNRGIAQGAGQSSYLLVTPEKQWNVLESTFGIIGGMSRIKFDSVVSILDSKEYYELLVSYDPFEEEWQPMGKYFHQDNQKVYTYNEVLDTSLLVFDFSLEINDTFNSSMGDEYKVVMTDSVTLMNGDKAKRIRFECDDVWIEGWGNNYVGLGEAEYLCYFDLSDHVTCAYESGDLQLMVADSCWYYQRTVDVDDHDIKPFAIYPNPTSAKLIIDGAQNGKTDYKIYDLLGRPVSEGIFSNDIDVSFLQVGSYYIVFIVGEQKVVRRFVKG